MSPRFFNKTNTVRLRVTIAKSLTLCASLLTLSACSVDQLLQVSSSAATNEPVGVTAPAGVQRDFGRAIASIEKGDAAAAEARLQAFIAEHPSYTNAYVNLAIIKDQQGDAAAAEHLLQHAIKIDNANVFALNRLGLIQRRAGEFSAAEQSWLEATRVQPNYPNAWYNLGVLYDLYLRDLQAAVDHYQRYQDLVGSSSDAMVARWITDLERRIDSAPQTANASEAML